MNVENYEQPYVLLQYETLIEVSKVHLYTQEYSEE